MKMGFINIILVIIFTICISTVLSIPSPPRIYIQPPTDVFYKSGEPVQIECVAIGEPQPTYVWKRNDIVFGFSGNDDRIVQLPNVGTLVFNRPDYRDEGVYQCLADNGYGVSASIKVNLRLAKIDSFPSLPKSRLFPYLGNPVTLNCISPASVPAADIFWAKKSDFGIFMPINYTARVTIDYEGRLRITNVLRDDDGEYACMAFNQVAREVKQSSSTIISTRGETALLSPARYMWTIPTDLFGIYGDEFKIKCIFSGNPTPDVHWIKTGGNLSDTVNITSFGQELKFNSLEFSDAGEYECWAENTMSTRREIRYINVWVESRPYWNIEPKDVEVDIGGTARYTCIGDGSPPPNRQWYINNVAIQDVTDPRITQGGRFSILQGGDTLELVNVTTADNMVIQCNMTNRHGSIFSDVYLKVLPVTSTIIG